LNSSVAIVSMTENRTIEHDNGTVSYEQIFNWNSKEKGYVLSSFYYGYLCTQVIGGVIAAKVGGNIVSCDLASVIFGSMLMAFFLLLHFDSCLASASE
jgi:hypothetical protein